MMHKCYDPKHDNYRYYGDRGITVDAHWHDFEQFYADMGPAPLGLTLERTDNMLGYSLGNCVWASRSVQARNRRSNRMLTYDGITKCLAEWSELTGIKPTTIWMRLRRGLPVEQALSGGCHF